jgi:hypothetical protein
VLAANLPEGFRRQRRSMREHLSFTVPFAPTNTVQS